MIKSLTPYNFQLRLGDTDSLGERKAKQKATFWCIASAFCHWKQETNC